MDNSKPLMIDTNTTQTEPSVSSESPPMPTVMRIVKLAKCIRCDFEWMPRVEHPAKCPRCKSILWDKPRAVQLPGKPPPQVKGKPRGIGFKSGQDERRFVQPKKEKGAEDLALDAP